MRRTLFGTLRRNVTLPAAQIITGPHPPRVLNFPAKPPTKKPKYALVSYLSQPVVDMMSGAISVRFSNDGLATSWVIVLNQLGYSVDIINWDDSSFVFDKPYDLVVSHGGINYPTLEKQLNPKTPYIYFSTGSYWKFHNTQEKKRINDFEKRHNLKLPYDRFIEFPEENANKRADAIICLGNDLVARTYDSFPRVFNLPIGSFTHTGHVKTLEELEAGRKDILFIAGAGNIHKGLDLVLDALRELPDFTLHIYTFLDDEFRKVYKKQLDSPRVKVYDFEAFPCEKFLEVTRRCNIAIMPSCSEGSPGSIVESMIQGLLPIVSAESHIDVDGCGLVLRHNTAADIQATITKLSSWPTNKLHQYSKQAHKIGLSRHSKKTYENNLRKIIKKAIKTV